MGQNDTAKLAGYANEAIPVARRLRYTGVHTDGRPKFSLAEAGESYDAISQQAATTLADPFTVALRDKQGTFEVTAAGAFSAGATLYGAADGKVDDTVSGLPQFTALEAATSAGSRVQVLKHHADAVDKNADWQDSVADRIDMTSAESADPAIGDRYIHTGSAGSSSETAQAVVQHHIYDWNGQNWTDITPTEGVYCRVEDENILYQFDGSSWSTAIALGALAIAAAGTITMGEGANISAGTTTGTEIGTAADQKLAVYGATPAVQQLHVADPTATAAAPDVATASGPAECAAMTFAAGSIDTGTDMTAAEAAQIVADLLALKTAIDANHTPIDALIVDAASLRTQLTAAIADVQANNAATDSILAQLAAFGIQASS